jgi:carnosine N-methyltransferase
VEAIERLLKPGGVWINLGPLLYHWATAPDARVEPGSDARYGQSVEVSLLCTQHCRQL